MIETMKSFDRYFMLGLVIVEVIFCAVIIKKVAYTEIDWIAYMQEVEGFLSGERNYLNIRGDTGPLVYPAGFLYIFTVLRWLTDDGTNIVKGQIVFAALYVAVTIATLYLCSKHKNLPKWALLTLIFSKRIHSIFVLRMFNDCVALLLGLLAVCCYVNSKWRFGSILYSLAVSVKMNMLLWAPGVLLVLLIGCGYVETVVCLTICALVQLILGYPFLSTYPVEYLMKSFELNRVFMYKWTVNYRFLSEEMFVHKYLSIVLLGLTVIALIIFAIKWIRENNAYMEANPSTKGVAFISKKSIDPHFIIVTIFTSNFIGVVFARTLHYQFYSWYFHTLPVLLWHTDVPSVVRLCVMAGIEVAFNVYPSTWWSSALLHVCHVVLLVGLLWAAAPKAVIDNKKQK